LGLFAAERLLVQFTNLLQRGLQLVIVGKATPHMSDLLLREADLTNDAAGVADGEDGGWMAFAAGAFGAAGAMADSAQEQGTAEDLASLGETGDEAVTSMHDLLLLHH
jgi:hypothetical protein